MIEASWRRDVPSASRDLTNRSRETVGSADSILATRDVLELRVRASWVRVTPLD